MDFGAAFSFVTTDPDWAKKLGIAAVLAFVGLITFGLGFIPLAGWVLAITRRVSQGTEPVLPEWTDFGTLVMDGLKMLAIALVWAIPIILVGICNGIVTAIVSSQGADDTITTVVSLITSCISIPYGILMALLEPAAFGHLAFSDKLGEAINPLNAFKILRENFGGYIITALVWVIVVPIIQSIGLILCIIGVFPAIAYSTAVVGHMMGQAYKGAKDAGLQLATA
jgi:hypothetical protein